jgi:hypothetical protein
MSRYDSEYKMVKPKWKRESKEEVKQRVMKYWDKDYTCGCGLYVHPDNPRTNSEAIHIKDCEFNPDRQKRIGRHSL